MIFDYPDLKIIIGDTEPFDVVYIKNGGIMKVKVCMSIIVVLVLSSGLFAEISSIGFKGGLNLSTMRYYLGVAEANNLDNSQESRKSFCIGGYITYNVTKKFAIEPEILYSRKGSKTSFESRIVEGTIESLIQLKTSWYFDYIEMPILFKFQIPIKENIIPFIYLGPAIGLNVYAGYKTDGFVRVTDGNTIIEDSEIDEEGLVDEVFEFKPFELSVDGGIGIAVKNYSFELRYVFGLPDIATNPPGIDDHNFVLSFILGYSF